MAEEILIDDTLAGKRLDQALTLLPAYSLSRSYAAKLIDDGAVLLNQEKAKASVKLRSGDRISLSIPEPEALDVAAEDIPLDIVYEDDDLLIVNKPKGMVVHPANGHQSGTLVNAVMHHCGADLSSINGVQRPGIVHRIDMNTTGLLVICKNDKTHKALAEQLKVHSITRKYAAIVCGNIKEESGTVDAPIGRSKRTGRSRPLTIGTVVKRSRTIMFWSVSEIIPWWNASWRPDAPTRFVCIWRVSGTRSWEMMSMAPAVVPLSWRVRPCMRRCWALSIPARANI